MLYTNFTPDPVLYYIGLTSALKVSLLYLWRNKLPKGAEFVGKVSELRLHPIKSGGGINVQTVCCDLELGPHAGDITDRHWTLATSDNALVNYKLEPSLVQFGAEFDKGHVIISCPIRDAFSLHIDDIIRQGKRVVLDAYDVKVRGIDCGESAAVWLDSVFPGKGYRLIHCPPCFESNRRVPNGNPKFYEWFKHTKDTDVISYQSSTPYHILGQASLDDLNSRLDDKVPADRFRPNIMIDGCKEYDEDTWRMMYIGNAAFLTAKLTGRCSFINIDTKSGTIISKEPLTVLSSYRKLIPEFGPVLGLHMVLARSGTIRVGDPVYVIRGDNTKKP